VRHLLRSIPLFLLLVPSVAGGIVLKDDVGRKVWIRRKAERIISLAPSCTEMLFAMGLGDKVIGITEQCDYPPEARRIRKVGSFSNPSLEAIISLKPDLILSGGGVQREIVLRLEKLSFPVLVLYPKDIRGIFRDIEMIGIAVGKPEKARKLIYSLQKRLEAVRKRASRIPYSKRPRVYVEISPDPLMTVGPSTFLNEMIEIAGGVNIAKGIKGTTFPRISAEYVLSMDPQVVILTYIPGRSSPISWISKRPGWGEVSAVKEGKVFADIDPNLILRPGPRIVLGVEELYKRFHGR
jgi:iron complex transport system substrate-binding protein